MIIKMTVVVVLATIMMNVGTMLKVHMYFLRRFCERSSAQVSWFFRGTSWSVVIVGLVPVKAMDPDTPTSSAFASYGIQLAEWLFRSLLKRCRICRCRRFGRRRKVDVD
ncbi:hypothetical protein HanIR_Chr12g0610391 [Helianthus annuus]|nr:hypothetical protein HanIR_Chr12g0610391 [Helianthus annuus]